MPKWRVTIALKLFLAVLLTVLLITTVSLFVSQWTMQKNFSRYVTQVEMQKLDHLNNNLAEIYQVYGSWTKAIENSLTRLDPDISEERKHRFATMWLLKQYEIAQRQNDLIKNPALFQNRIDQQSPTIDRFMPSHFDPFARPPEQPQNQQPSKDNDQANPSQPSEQQRRWIIPLPDRLGYGNRLSLHDANKSLVMGDATPEVPMQEIIVDQKVVGYLGLRPAIDVDDALSINFFSNQQRYLLLIYSLSILASLVVALLLANTFRKPIHRLLHAAQELSRGNYQHHVEVQSNDELGDLSNVINQLARILDQHEQSRRQWVADTSHELKTPLSVLQAQIEAMQDGVRKATPEHLARMQQQVMSLKKLTQDLSDLAQADAQQLRCYFSQIQPWQLVLNEVVNFSSQFEQKNLKVTVEEDDAEPIYLNSDPDRLRQIIVNLLSNAVRYTEAEGQIHIHREVTNTEWILHIDDSPLGVSDEQLAQLGQRFYRVDDSRTRSTGGTGLGLALSKQIAQILGGDLQFSHSPFGGLRCTVRLNRHLQKND
ncbi:sensor histidine kinase efflux regulator BaeS [Acinetobacter sp.]|uniref:sensor histidine kinase efflux regulator BaeS n=1 Tax=Acinetobacter sp. TaxID=472 RepID=UPI0035B24F1F